MEEKNVNRRGFIKGAVGVGVGAVAASLALTGCSNDASGTGASGQTEEANWDYDVDVAVAGFGIGGAIASLAAQQAGASVVCVEAYTQVGGTSVDSGGGASAPTSLEAASALMPYGDLDLLETFVNSMPNATKLVNDIGAPVRAGASDSSFTIGAESTHDSRLECFEYMAEVFTDEGGTLLMETKCFELLVDESGAIEGMLARDAEGTILRIKAKSVILACGGFQNNSELKTKFFGPYGDQAVCRSVPTNDGTGMIMAQKIGAGLSKSLGTFYGHSIAANIEHNFMEFSEISSQYHDNRSIVINLEGKRFADEGMGLAGDLNNQALISQRWGRGCLIFDQFIYDEWGSTTAGGTPTGVDRTKEVMDRGGRVVSADTIEELAEKISAWGYNRASVINTIEEYNASVDAETTSDLAVPRTAGMIASIVKIAQPPFWATEVICGVSCCFGGLLINPDAEVLKADGGEAIPGLYAVPGTAGGITFVHYYVSSIGAAAAYGHAAATNAVAYVNSK